MDRSTPLLTKAALFQRLDNELMTELSSAKDWDEVASAGVDSLAVMEVLLILEEISNNASDASPVIISRVEDIYEHYVDLCTRL